MQSTSHTAKIAEFPEAMKKPVEVLWNKSGRLWRQWRSDGTGGDDDAASGGAGVTGGGDDRAIGGVVEQLDAKTIAHTKVPPIGSTTQDAKIAEKRC